tara:strand:- start:3314 stop:3838 length:525 start_codon:yes stop_codon:yes gene_type:complete
MSKCIPVVAPSNNIHTSVPIVGTVTPIVVNDNISITSNMRKIYAMRKTLMLLCLIDIFFSFLYALNNITMIIPLFFAVCGYYGVKNYKLINTYFYIVYELIIILGRIVLFGYYVSYGIVMDGFYIAMLILSTVIGLWVLELLYKYTTILKKLSDEDILLLKNMGYIPNAYRIYY